MTTSEVQALRVSLRADLVTAMKKRHTEAVDAVRTAIAAIDNAEAVAVPAQASGALGGRVAGAVAGLGAAEVPRKVLSIEDVHELLRAQLADLVSSADLYEHTGRYDDAERLRRQVAVITGYLPR